MGVKVQYNPSTGKVSYNPATGKVQVVQDPVRPGVPCDMCDSVITEVKMTTFGVDTCGCFQAAVSPTGSRQLIGPWSTHCNRVITLNRRLDLTTICFYDAVIALPANTLFLHIWNTPNDCSGAPDSITTYNFLYFQYLVTNTRIAGSIAPTTILTTGFRDDAIVWQETPTSIPFNCFVGDITLFSTCAAPALGLDGGTCNIEETP